MQCSPIADHRPAALIEKIERLYVEGKSIRAVSREVGINRESIRLHLVSEGLIRDRLAYHGAPYDRIMAKVSKGGPDDCWPWRGLINNKGYGLASLDGRVMAAQRAVYMLLVGPIPDDLDACHHCDNPPCVNPGHIFIGTRADNMQDASRKGRLRRGDRHVHRVLTEAQVRRAHGLRRSGMRVADISRKLDLPYKTLWAALRGKSWAWLKPGDAA